jgi:hypothetical protein
MPTYEWWAASTWRRKPLQPANFHPVTERSAGVAALKRPKPPNDALRGLNRERSRLGIDPHPRFSECSPAGASVISLSRYGPNPVNATLIDSH